MKRLFSFTFKKFTESKKIIHKKSKLIYPPNETYSNNTNIRREGIESLNMGLLNIPNMTDFEVGPFINNPYEFIYTNSASYKIAMVNIYKKYNLYVDE
jgi:hypothetical protein